MKSVMLVAACAAAVFLAPFAAFAGQTSLSYSSSPSSWVGGGQTVTVDPSEGFAFQVQRNFDNGISFAVNDFASNPDFQATRWWYLDFAAANGAALQVGTYANATRFPFQSPSEPGLSFIGNGRGDNQLTGSFSVLSVRYAADGTVLSFDATFLQNDENNPAAWNTGEIRYNVSAVPEADPALMLGLGSLLLGLWGARSRRAS